MLEVCPLASAVPQHELAYAIHLSHSGLGVLFGKLQQGVQENQQILIVARMRAEAEDVYGQKLGEIEVATLKVDGGFAKDDGASVKKVRQ